jgi:hypothetical protein
MSDKYLTRRHRKYTRISPGAVYETTVQTLIENNISSLFPEYFGKIFEPYFRTPAGDVKPDLVLIRHDYKGWMLVEVEVEGHSPSAHILPQLAKLTFAMSNDEVLGHFVDHFSDSHNAKDMERALSTKPEVVLVIHGSSDGFQLELKKLGVVSLDVEIHSFPPNEYILEVFDRAENFIDTGLICARSSNIATQYVWVLPTIEGLPYDQLNQNIEVRVNEESSIWRIEQKKNNYLLRQPSDIQSLNGVARVSVLRHRSFLSLKFLPIPMEENK